MFADFTAGLGTITAQNIVGNSLAGAATTPSSFAISALDATNDASNFMQAQTTPGTPITGTATLPAAATMTASVNGGPSVAITNGSFSIPVPGGLGGAQDATPSIHVSPHAVRAGSKVKVYGIAPTGAKLTLMSTAFASNLKVSGLPAVTTPVRAGGRYSATVQIAANTKPSTYGSPARSASATCRSQHSRCAADATPGRRRRRSWSNAMPQDLTSYPRGLPPAQTQPAP